MIVNNNLNYNQKKRTSQTQPQTKTQTQTKTQNPYQAQYQAQAKAAQQAQKQTQAQTQARKQTQTTASRTSSYTPVDNSGNDYASLSGMSSVHRAALDAAKSAWDAANSRGDQAGMDAAHKKAESIRALYGYSGGGDGSEYIPIAKQDKPKTQVQTQTWTQPQPQPQTQPKPQTQTQAQPQLQLQPKPQPPAQTQTQTQPVTYQEPTPPPVYVNRYQDLIDELKGKVVDRDPFAYDAERDPLYQQYRASYTRGGQRAMQDTLGQMAARTGGMASSYAGSAAQQSYDGYMTALAGKIPELQQLAYEMYQDEGDKQRLNLEMISALEREDYNKYQDLLGQYNTDRSFAYGQYRDQLADQRYADAAAYSQYLDQLGQYNTDRSFAYGQYRDQLADQRYADETSYGRYRDQLADQRYTDETSYSRYRDQLADQRYAGETAYSRYLDQLGQYNTDRSFAYGQYRDQLADQRYADETAYDRGVQADQTAYDRGTYADERDYDRRLQRAKLLAESGDFSGYQALGFSAEEIQRLQEAYLRQHPELGYRYGYGTYGYNWSGYGPNIGG